MFNKNNLIIADIASKNSDRVEITGVLFKKDRTVATDAYKLIEVKNPEIFQKNDDIPVLPDKTKVWNGFLKKGVILPVKAIKKIRQNLPDIKNSSLPVLKSCWFTDKSNAEMVEIASTDLEIVNKIQVKNIQGNFPDYQNIIPKNYKQKITISIKHLKDMIKTLEAMDIQDGSIELAIKDDISPVMIKAKTKQEQEITGLLMPIKK